MTNSFKKYYDEKLEEGLAGDLGYGIGKAAGKFMQGVQDFKTQASQGYRKMYPDPGPTKQSTPEPIVAGKPASSQSKEPSFQKRAMNHPSSFSSTFSDPTSPISQFAGILKDLQRDASDGKIARREFSPIKVQVKDKEGNPVTVQINVVAAPPMF